MSKVGSMFWEIFLDTRNFVSGTTLTKRELNELRRTAAENAGEIGKLGSKFDNLARLGRDLNQGLGTASLAFANMATKSREAEAAAGDYIAQLRRERKELDLRSTFGVELSKAERTRLETNEQIAAAFERQVAALQKLKQEEASKQARKSEQQDFIDDLEEAQAEVKEFEQRREQQIRENREAERAAHLSFLQDLEVAQGEVKEFEQTRKAAASNRIAAEKAANREFLSELDVAQAEVREFERNRTEQRKLETQRRAEVEKKASKEWMDDLGIAQKEVQQFEKKRKKAADDREKSEKAASKATRDHRKHLQGVASQVAALAKQISILAAAYRIWGSAARALKQNLELERSQKMFEIFTGSAGQADFITSGLRRLAAETPLTLESTTAATRTLLQYGVAAQDVLTHLKQLGDVSGGSHEQLQRLALAFGQITANTRLQGQELRQLTEAGFNPLSEIAKQTGRDMLELRDAMADGEISFEMVRDALDSATSAGGRFNDQLNTIASETNIGKIQRLRGEFELLAVDLAQAHADVFGSTADLVRHQIFLARRDAAAWNAATKNVGTYALAVDALWRGDFFSAMRAGIGFTELQGDDRIPFVLWDSSRPDSTPDAIADGIDKIRQEYRKLNDEFGKTKAQLDLTKAVLLLEKSTNTEHERAVMLLKQEINLLEKRTEMVAQVEKMKQKEAQFAQQVQQKNLQFIQTPFQAMVQEFRALELDRFSGQSQLSARDRQAARDRITQEFIDEKVKEITDSNVEAATVATAGSVEEFQMISQIERSRMAGEDKKHAEQKAWHEARLQAIEANKTAVESLPDALKDFFPELVGQ